MSREKVLIAATGGISGDEPSAMLVDGYCVPLAATDTMREGVIEAEGEDRFADWLAERVGKHPGAGGLWVLECNLSDTTGSFKISGARWRAPTGDEIAALLAAQRSRAAGRTRRIPPEGTPSRWVSVGALV
jgi:hypothetical protein